MGICLDKSSDERFSQDGGEYPRSLEESQGMEEQNAMDAKRIDLVDDIGDNPSTNLESSSLNRQIKTKVTLQDFVFIKVLGRGSFGKVMLVEYKLDKKYYAMKILRKDMVEKKNQKIHTRNERTILESVKHPFLVQLYFAFQTSGKLYLIMDFMIGGELFFHLRRSFKFTEDRAKFYCAELILALEYLHLKKIIYRDLKPENILIGEDGHLKLTDFGLSKIDLKEGEKTNTFCGTPEYLAPEILLSQGHDQSVDWWSLGALLYEMLSGAPPFYSRDKSQMFRNRLEKPIEMKQWFSQDAISLLQQLLQNNPAKRLGSKGAEEVKKHPFFDEINWDSFMKKSIEPPFKPKIQNLKDLRNFDQLFTDEAVQDTPVQGFNQRQDTYDKFTYVKTNQHDVSQEKNQPADKYVEVNDHFGFKEKT